MAGGALTLIVVLLLLLGGLLDGLYNGSTGAYRAQSAQLIVYAEESRNSLIRSRVDPATTQAIAEVDGVTGVSGLGVVLIGGSIPGETETVDLAVFGYEEPNRQAPAPPAPGTAYADRSLEAAGLQLGETLAIGPAEVPVEVVGWVEDTRFLFQSGVWTHPDTWREVLAASRPDAAVAPGTFQVVLVETSDDPAAVAAAIEAEVPGTSALTIDDAILALPGVEAQQQTFVQIIWVTFVVAGLVVALFFALIVIERLGLFGVLKAVGASSRTLGAGLVTQALLIALGAFVIGGLIAVGLALVIPDEVPVELEPRRAIFTVLGLVATALIGSAISFRKIIRVDPASAVGGG